MNRTEFQVCTYEGAMKYFDNFKEAYCYALKVDAMKVSFNSMRWRPKWPLDVWSAESEAKLETMCSTYDREALFWVHQSTMPDNVDDIMSDTTLSRTERDIQWNLGCLREILTNEEFVTRFSS